MGFGRLRRSVARWRESSICRMVKVPQLSENGLPWAETVTATLSNSIYLYKQAVNQAKYMTTNVFFDFSAPRYLTGRHVIPRFCGIYRSFASQ